MRAPRTVVVVDDDKMMRFMLRVMLTTDNYQVIGEAANGSDGIDLCRKLKPDLVLLDINMPKMNGMLALEMILSESPGSKVIMVTVDARRENVEEAIARGASGFVVKPFNTESVMATIDRCFKAKGSSN